MHGSAPLALSFVALLAATTPAAAEEGGTGRSLIEEGARLLFRGLIEEMRPELDALPEPGFDFGAFLRLAPLLGDLPQYQAPEVLPNGDILIRRRPPARPAPDLPEPGENGEVDL